MKCFQLSTALATLAIVCMFASDASAQRRGGGMRNMMQNMNRVVSRMLAMDEVQEELKFSDEQKEEIGAAAKELSDEMMGEMRSMFQGGGGVDPTEMNDLIEEFVEKEKEIIAKLNDEQKKRLQQLQYQQMRMGIFENEKAVEKLGITDEQKTSIKDAIETNQSKQNDAMREAMQDGDRESIMEIRREMAEELQESIMEILTDEQKKTLEEMKGESFEFPRRGRRGGRRSDF